MRCSVAFDERSVELKAASGNRCDAMRRRATLCDLAAHRHIIDHSHIIAATYSHHLPLCHYAIMHNHWIERNKAQAQLQLSLEMRNLHTGIPNGQLSSSTRNPEMCHAFLRIPQNCPAVSIHLQIPPPPPPQKMKSKFH